MTWCSRSCLLSSLIVACVGVVGCGEDAVSIEGENCPDLEIYGAGERDESGELVNRPGYLFDPGDPEYGHCVTPVGSATTGPRPRGSGGASSVDAGGPRDAGQD